MEYLDKLNKCFSWILAVLHIFAQQSSVTFFPEKGRQKIPS